MRQPVFWFDLGVALMVAERDETAPVEGSPTSRMAYALGEVAGPGTRIVDVSALRR